MGLGQINLQAPQSYNEKLASLLERYFAYSDKEEEVKAKDLIQQLKLGNPLKSSEDVSHFLKQFDNDHLTVVQEGEFSESPCVTGEVGRISLLSFWCQQEKDEQVSTIRNRFAEAFLSSLEKSLKGDSVDTLIIDLKGNKGGGDDEMEFALYPFIKEGIEIYHYQFKFLTSPRTLPRMIAKLAKVFGLEDRLKAKWDKRYPYLFHLKKDKWSPSQLKRLEDLKSKAKDLKIVIEVDQLTASASELYSGILAKKEKVTVKGGPTRGCVGAPNVYDLEDLKISIPAVRVFF